jgi:flagellar biosynthesis/type III secretory pathway chaperone
MPRSSESTITPGEFMFYLSMLLAIYSDVNMGILDDGYEYNFAIVYRDFVARFDEDSSEVARLIEVVDSCGYVSDHCSQSYKSWFARRIIQNMLKIMKEPSDAWKLAKERSEELDRSTQALETRLHQQRGISSNDLVEVVERVSNALSHLDAVESIEPVYSGSNIDAIHSVAELGDHVKDMMQHNQMNQDIMQTAVYSVQSWSICQRMSTNSSLHVAETQDELSITQAEATVPREALEKTTTYYQGIFGWSRLPY